MHSLLIRFNTPLHHADIPAFRGAFAAMAGLENDLFHNHEAEGDGYQHRYPRIQYRVHGGKAAVFGINEGAKALEGLIKGDALSRFSMNGRRLPLQIVSSNRDRGFVPAVLPAGVVATYRIYHYLPFTTEAYQEYKSYGDIRQKAELLERLLVNHILSFAKGAGWELGSEELLRVTLKDIDRVKKVNVLGVNMMAFDLVFTANALLPEGIGLGRKTAFAFGWVLPLG